MLLSLRSSSKEGRDSLQNESKVILNQETTKTSQEMPNFVEASGFLLCPRCPYKSSLRKDVKRHMKALHENIKDFKCDMCNFASSYSYSLKDHIKSMHERKRVYSCKLCNHTSTHLGQTHIRTCTSKHHTRSQIPHLNGSFPQPTSSHSLKG